MKKPQMAIYSLVLVALFCLSVFAQSRPTEATRYAKNGLSFEYPSDLTLEDQSNEGGQHLVLNQGTGAQIMIISRYEALTSAEQEARARREVADKFMEAMELELKKLAANVERTAVEIEVGGGQAKGVRLRAAISNVPGSVEGYALKLGKRLVLVTLIGSEKEIASATAAWATIRRTLKVE
jgi:hypothetical protein